LSCHLRVGYPILRGLCVPSGIRAFRKPALHTNASAFIRPRNERSHCAARRDVPCRSSHCDSLPSANSSLAGSVSSANSVWNHFLRGLLWLALRHFPQRQRRSTAGVDLSDHQPRAPLRALSRSEVLFASCSTSSRTLSPAPFSTSPTPSGPTE
jgi:hypothetical protein